MALQTMIDSINRARKAYDDTMRELGGGLQQAVVEHLAAALPAGCSIQWDQYTPYFNDGDPCRFRVRTSVMFQTRKIDRFTKLYEDAEDCISIDGRPSTYYGKQSWSRLIEGISGEQLDALAASFHALPEDVMERAFGDHVMIRVNSDGTHQVGERDHD